MAKRKPVSPPYQRKLSVQDVRSTETPVGIGMENDEMRRIAMRVNDLTDELEQLRPAPVDDGGKKNPIKDRGDVIGGDTAGDITNITINGGGGGKWALTVLHRGVSIFREKWQQALNFLNPRVLEHRDFLPVLFKLKTATIADSLKADPTHPATQVDIEGEVPDTTLSALEFFNGRKSIQRYENPVPTNYPAILGIDSREINTRYFELVNDELNPAATHYYGTDATGEKGFYDLVGLIELHSDILPTDGLDGQYLSNDGAGTLYWENLPDPLTGTENNTIRFNAAGEMEETGHIQVNPAAAGTVTLGANSIELTGYETNINSNIVCTGASSQVNIKGGTIELGEVTGQNGQLLFDAGNGTNSALNLFYSSTYNTHGIGHLLEIDSTDFSNTAGTILVANGTNWEFDDISNYASAPITGTFQQTLTYNEANELISTNVLEIMDTVAEKKVSVFETLNAWKRINAIKGIILQGSIGDTFLTIADANGDLNVKKTTGTGSYTLDLNLNGAETTEGTILVRQSDGTFKFKNISHYLGSSSGPTFESRTLTANVTVNKSDGWANYVRLTNAGADKVITLGTGYAAGDYFYFTMSQNTGGIYFYIQSKYVAFIGGGVLALWFDGTNWNNILPNQRSYNDSNVARSINYGINNSTANNGVAVGISCQAKGDLNVAYGDSVNMGTGTNQVGYGVNVNGSGGNNQTLIGEDINSSGTFNNILGEIGNGGGSYNNLVVRNSQNPNTKNYLKGLGQGIRFLHTGEFALKIDGNNYSTTATQSHLRIANFGAITTNATQTEIYLNDSVSTDRLVVPAKSSYMIKGRMSAVQSDFSDIKHWEFSCSLLRDGSNNTSLQGSTHITVLQESTGATAWDLLLSADNTNESLKVEVVGQASQTIYWKGIFEIIDLMLP